MNLAKLLCHFGFHDWQTEAVVTAEDIIALYYETGVCKRCGKIDDADIALEAYEMMRANFRTTNVRITTHPGLCVPSDSNARKP